VNMMKESTKTIKTAKKNGSYWSVEYAEFDGTYYLHDSEYKLQRYVEKVLNERTILPSEIEKLLDLHSDVLHYERNMEECD
jgi:hypothetical protein